jgi:uncharacterized membrane protein YcaP (DUF421 family)
MPEWLWPDNWREMLSLNQPLLESVLRGVLIYAGVFVLMRVVPRRESGGISISDILLVNLVVEAVSNGLQGEHKSVFSGLVTGATTLVCAYAVDWLSYHSPWFSKVTDPPPKPLVQDGRLKHQNLEEQLITREELESQVRQQGLENLAQVKHAVMEPDGQISVVPKDEGEKKQEAPAPPERPAERRRRDRGEVLERLWAMQRKVEQQQAHIEALLQELMLQPKG